MTEKRLATLTRSRSSQCGVLRTEIESIAVWRSNDHDERHDPFQQVGTKRRAKGLCRHPEARIRKDTLPRQDLVAASKVLICSTAYRPISRIKRDCPISTANRLPKALNRTRTLSAVTARPGPKTAVKKTAAAICSEAANSSLGTVDSSCQQKERPRKREQHGESVPAAKYAMLQRM